MHPCAVLPACSYMAEHVTGQCLSVARVRLGLVAIIKQGDLASVRARRRKPAACHDVPCRPSLIMQPKLRVQWLCRASSCTKKTLLITLQLYARIFGALLWTHSSRTIVTSLLSEALAKQIKHMRLHPARCAPFVLIVVVS